MACASTSVWLRMRPLRTCPFISSVAEERHKQRPSTHHLSLLFLPLPLEHTDFPLQALRRAGAGAEALRGREEEVPAAAGVREPDEVRGHHLTLL